MPASLHSFRLPLAPGLLVLSLALPLAARGEPGTHPDKATSGKGSAAAVAKAVIGDAIETALKILRDEQLKKDGAKRVGRLRAAVDGVFDWEAMARSSVGPHWRALDDAQRADFVRVFKELLARRYMNDIDRFSGSEQLNVTGSEARGQQVLVKTVLITASREHVPIDYTMHKPKGSWVVEDISIEGVSMVNHYRKSFGRYLVNNDFASLLQRLKRKLGDP
ncbi:MAG: ABC transporter substrate-binding protein [Myxococcales bacterium]|nr:ABC transporter substrate-binding protein [Myxococcales bacterium]MDD9969606.1 ABC transporter substrate-binding protein [Myxococcales bacterium]